MVSRNYKQFYTTQMIIPMPDVTSANLFIIFNAQKFDIPIVVCNVCTSDEEQEV
jgi:hypothetical protein